MDEPHRHAEPGTEPTPAAPGPEPLEPDPPLRAPEPEPEPPVPEHPGFWTSGSTPSRPVAVAGWRPPDDTAAAADPNDGRLRVGGIVGRSLDTYAAEWSLFLILALPLGAAAAVATIPGLELIGLGASLAVVIFVGAATMLATSDLWDGVEPSIPSILRRTAGRALPVLLSSLAVLIIVAGLLGLALLPALVAPPLAIVTVIPIVAGIAFVGVRWTLAQPAIVLDGAGPLDGLNRSWAVTRGSFWRLLGLSLLAGFVTGPATSGAQSLAVYSDQRLLAAIAALLGTTISAPLLFIPATIAYRDLLRRGVPAGATPRVSVGRGRGRAAGLVVGLGFVLFAMGSVATAQNEGVTFIPDRGTIFAGRTANVLDPCRPGDVGAVFQAGEPISIGGYFRRPLGSDETADIRLYVDGDLVFEDIIEATFLGAECWYEPEPVTDLPFGEWRFVIADGDEVLAEGSFRIE